MASSAHELVVKVIPDMTEVDAEAARRQQPSVGRIVHYVSHGSPVRPDGTQAFSSQCRAAIITEVGPIPDGDMAQADIEHWDEEARHVVGLCAINPTGLFFHSIADGGSLYDPNRSGGTWHWPERV